MKIEIELPDKGANIKKIRKMFKKQVSRPLEKALRSLGYDDWHFNFNDEEDLLDDNRWSEAPEIATGFFCHLENDPDDPIEGHHFSFWSNSRGRIESSDCPLCKITKIIGDWEEVLKILMEMIKKDAERMGARIADIERLAKAIALLK